MEWDISKEHCPNLIETDTLDQINNTKKMVHVSVRWGTSFIRTWPSLVHLWSSWYREYYISKTPGYTDQNNLIPYDTIPRLMIRFEDILFHTEEVINEIRKCVGAKWIKNNNTNNNSNSNTNTNNDINNNDEHTNDENMNEIYNNFVYAKLPTKTHPYFSKFKAHQSSLVSALIKYGQENINNNNNNGINKNRRIINMTSMDVEFAHLYLDNELLELFHYTHPSL